MSYEPEKTSWWGTKHVWYGDILFVALSVIFYFIAMSLEARFELLDGSGANQKFILGKSINFIVFSFLALGLTRVADRTFGGNLKRGIAYDPIACAIYMGVLLLVGALVWNSYQ